MLFSQRLRVTQMKGRYYTIYTTNHLIHFFFFWPRTEQEGTWNCSEKDNIGKNVQRAG